MRGYDILTASLATHYLIYGAGTMGLMMVELAKRAGRLDDRRRRPQRRPARGRARGRLHEHVANAADQSRRRAAGTSSSTAPASWRRSRTASPGSRGGTFQQFGVSPTDATAFSPYRVYNDEITIVGSMAVLNTYERAVEMFAAGAINADAMVSHAFTLDDYGAALEMFRAGQGRKLQIRPQLDESMELL